MPIVFGKYRLLERLGRGGVTDAFRAKSIGAAGFEKMVVVWRIHPEGGGGAELADTLMSEAKRAACLSHANIAQVLDVGTLDGLGFVVTEYVKGRSLAALLGTQVPWTLAVYIAIQVAQGLDHAHGRKDAEGRLLQIVHRGVSPHRILLSTAGDVKLTGFGTARPHGAHDLNHEAIYRSPEQLRGEPVDGRSDIFSLGVVLRECLSGVDTPPALREAIDHALEPYPEGRSTARQLHAELCRILHTTKQTVSPRDLAGLVSVSGSGSASVSASASGSGSASVRTPLVDDLLRAADELESRGALSAAIEHLEIVLAEVDPFANVGATLALCKRFGRLCARAHVGERGATPLIAALDLADAVGRDDYAATFCRILGELLAQADRTDESCEWFDRAARKLHSPLGDVVSASAGAS